MFLALIENSVVHWATVSVFLVPASFQKFVVHLSDYKLRVEVESVPSYTMDSVFGLKVTKESHYR